MTGVIEPTCNVREVGPCIHDWLVEFDRYAMPQPREFVWEQGRGPLGGWMVELQDGAWLFCADPPWSKEQPLVPWGKGAEAAKYITRCFCAVCGAFDDDGLHLSVRIEIEAWDDGQAITVVPPIYRYVCHPCLVERDNAQEDLGKQWSIELNRLTGNRLLKGYRDAWEQQHPRRMQPFR